jgi:ATP-dependent Clp endopeptidase proteolytic subunit ClpP
MSMETFRYRGQTPPKQGARASVLAFAPNAADVTDGVATMRLYDPIDSWGGDWGVSAKEFAAALDALPEDTTEIRLHINSPGGEVFDGIAIMNQLRAHKARVVAVVDGLAASAASFIATSADEVVMGPNSQLMIHDAWGLAIGNAADMRSLADRLDHLSNNIASVYAAKSGGTVESWREAMLAESWYSAEESVTAKLADRVDGQTADDKAKASFDLSVFQYAGREQAPPPPIPTAPEMTPEAPVVAGMSKRQDARHRMAARRHSLV